MGEKEAKEAKGKGLWEKHSMQKKEQNASDTVLTSSTFVVVPVTVPLHKGNPRSFPTYPFPFSCLTYVIKVRHPATYFVFPVVVNCFSRVSDRSEIEAASE